MGKVVLFSLLLIAGLVGSQLLPADALHAREVIALGTMAALAFIMIHVGFEFEVDQSRPVVYAWDATVAFIAAGLPWLLCAAYFVFVMMPRELWHTRDAWEQSLLQGLFAAPTSAGVLFSMLAAAGLSTTWLFGKAKILAIFDDLGTILLMIPMKILLVGAQWQLGVIVIILFALLAVSWRYLHKISLPTTWPWVIGYAVLITAGCHGLYLGSLAIDPGVPVHLEVLLPAFALGCVMKRTHGDPHTDDARVGHQEGPAEANEQRVSTIVSALFMVLVGLSMPSILPRGEAAMERPAVAQASGGLTVQRSARAETDREAGPSPKVSEANSVSPSAKGVEAASAAHAAPPGEAVSILHFDGVPPAVIAQANRFPGWGVIALHVAAITVLSNLGKMFSAFCYRKQAALHERVALAIGMFPRGEVGAGVLVVALSYGIAGPILTVAVLSLAVNLMGTGLFIVVVKKLLAYGPSPERESPAV